MGIRVLKQNGYLTLRDLRYYKYIKNLTIQSSEIFFTPHPKLSYLFEVDYWSVAIIIYEIYTGFKPFVGYNNDKLLFIFRL